MSVQDFRYDILAPGAWAEGVQAGITMARIEGVIDGQRWAALVPPALAQDQPAAEAWLLYVARNTPPNPVDGIEVVG